MFQLALPWWELLVRGAVVYAALLVLVRLSGKRTVGQFTPFDLVVVLLLSEAVSNGLTGGEQSVTGGLLVAATLVALNFSLAWITSRSSRAEQMLEGREVLLGRDGVVYSDVLKRQHVSPSDFQKALRASGCDQADMRCAFLEVDGSISVIKR